MALIKCKECGKEISDKANTCPNCGNPINDDTITKEVKATKKVAIFIIAILVVVCIIGFIFGYFIPAHTYYKLNPETNQYDEKYFKLF